MGFSPVDVDRMTLRQLTTATAGWVAAQGGEEKPDSSDMDLDDLFAKTDFMTRAK